MKNKRRNPDIETALRLYYSSPELGTSDIKELFGVGETVAQRMKNEVKRVMADQNIKAFLPHSINTRVAYEVWRIDVDDYERRLKKLRELERSGVNVKGTV